MCQAEKKQDVGGLFLHLKIPAKNVENIWFPFGSLAILRTGKTVSWRGWSHPASYRKTN